MRPLLHMLAGPESAALGGHSPSQGGAMVVPSLDVQPIQNTQLSLEDVFATVV